MMKIYSNFIFILFFLIAFTVESFAVGYKCRFSNGDASYDVTSQRVDVIDSYESVSNATFCHLSYPDGFIVTNATFDNSAFKLNLYGSQGCQLSIDCVDPFSPQISDYKGDANATNSIILCDINLSSLPLNSTNYYYADGRSVGYVSTTNNPTNILLADTNILIRGIFYTNHNPISSPVECVYDTNGFLVVACRTDGLKIFSANPQDPNFGKEITCYKTKGDARAIAIKNGIIWLAEGSNGIGAYKLDEVGLISHLRQYTLLRGSANDIVCHGNSLYAACEEALLVTVPLDLNKRQVPTIIDSPSKDLLEYSNLMISTNNILKVVDSKNRKTILYDISQPQPKLISLTDLSE